MKISCSERIRLAAFFALLVSVGISAACLATGFGGIVNGQKQWITLGFGWISIVPLLVTTDLLELACRLFPWQAAHPVTTLAAGRGLAVLVGGPLFAISHFLGSGAIWPPCHAAGAEGSVPTLRGRERGDASAPKRSWKPECQGGFATKRTGKARDRATGEVDSEGIPVSDWKGRRRLSPPAERAIRPGKAELHYRSVACSGLPKSPGEPTVSRRAL